LQAIDGTWLELEPHTICTHSDTRGAVAIVSAVRSALLDAGVEIRSPGA
jgi:UPF0271 protein